MDHLHSLDAVISRNRHPNLVATTDMANNMISETFLHNRDTNFSGLDNLARPGNSIACNIRKTTVQKPPPTGWLKRNNKCIKSWEKAVHGDQLCVQG